jgi:hypothetical protein
MVEAIYIISKISNIDSFHFLIRLEKTLLSTESQEASASRYPSDAHWLHVLQNMTSADGRHHLVPGPWQA